jgi:hypothetical protein
MARRVTKSRYVPKDLRSTIAYHLSFIDKLINAGAIERAIPLNSIKPMGRDVQAGRTIARFERFGLITLTCNRNKVQITDRYRLYQYGYALDSILCKETHIRRIDEWEQIINEEEVIHEAS